MLLGRIQYVGKAYAFNKVQRQYRLVEHLDQVTARSRKNDFVRSAIQHALSGDIR